MPFLPFFIRDLGVSEPTQLSRWSGLVYAGPFVISFFLTPIWGFLADKYGQKPMVVRAIFGLALSQALIGFSVNVEMLLTFRIVQGAVSGFIAAALALVAATTPEEKTGYALGILQTATSSGTVVGPLLGGTLADLFGFRPLFFIVAGLCTISGFLIVWLVKVAPNPGRTSEKAWSIWSNYRYAFNSKILRTTLLVIVISGIALTLPLPIFALFVESLIEQTSYLATLTGFASATTGFVMIFSSPFWGKLNDTKDFRRNLLIATAGAVIAFSGQAFVSNITQLLFLRALQGFFMGGIVPALYASISKNSSLERRGGIMGIASSFNILASFLGPIMGGDLAARVGFRGNFASSGVIMFVSFLVTYIYLKANIGIKGSKMATTLTQEAL